MRRRASFVSGILSLTLACTLTFGASGPPQNIILFGWDGAQRDHVKECLNRGELASLQKLIDKGRMVEIDAEGTTDTKAGWSQILTGYYPEVTGVYSNRQFQPIPQGLSIFERLEHHFGPGNFVTAAVIANSNNLGTAGSKKIRVATRDDSPQAGKAAADHAKRTGVTDDSEPIGELWIEGDLLFRVVQGEPFHVAKDNMDLFENGLREDGKVGMRAIELLEKYEDKPFFFFVHFGRVDEAGHEYGENSKEYNDALISNDLWTGRIMAKVEELGLGRKTQFYVTSDHGFDEGRKEHSFAPYVFLATDNRQVARNGRRQDIAPTIMEAFGLDTGKFEPRLDGISLTQPDNREPAKISSAMHKPDVLYVPTPQDVVDMMLRMAKVTKDDVVYDLGCGDGRIVVTAAKRYGCKAFGYDISPRRVAESLENVRKNNVEHLVRIEQKDIFTLDFSEADVVTLFLLPSLNVKLIPQLDKLKPGSRIVSHNFEMRGVMPDRTVKLIPSGDSSAHTIYLWTTPLDKVWLRKNGQPPRRPK